MLNLFKTARSHRHTRVITVLALFVFACIVTATIVIARNVSSVSSVTAAPATTSTAALRPIPPASGTEVEMVTLRPWGFEPQEITRPPGPFVLAVDNHSELDQLEISLDVESGPKVHAVDVSKNKFKWRKKLALPPGVYALRETSHPEWLCRITIQP